MPNTNQPTVPKNSHDDFIADLIIKDKIRNPTDEAVSCDGSIDEFDARLAYILGEYKATCSLDQQKLSELEAEKNGLDKQLINEMSSLETLELEKKEYENKIAITKTKPSFLQKMGMVFYPLFLLFLSAYLYIFYSSAIYSATFRTIDIGESAVLSSVFYPKALSESWELGDSAIALVLLAPFIFFVFGIIVHKLSEKESLFLKISTTISVLLATFFVDYIIAYEICQKIYDAKAANSFKEIPAYSSTLAFSDMGFWFVIVMGFAVYLAWGTLLKFTINHFKAIEMPPEVQKLHALLEKTISRIDSKKEIIEKLKSDLVHKTVEIDTCRQTIVFKPSKLKMIADNFTDEWLDGVNQIRDTRRRPDLAIYKPRAETILKSIMN